MRRKTMSKKQEIIDRWCAGESVGLAVYSEMFANTDADEMLALETDVLDSTDLSELIEYLEFRIRMSLDREGHAAQLSDAVDR